ncbi:unnamed protein product [[Candida] boidinii]|uniref:Unnamed protein product n=1 Tax=Candida boidinii TaxID=5477 RepID=A0A9W6WAN6_CANBO|nr:unnamed protein product [[Candida] boidinii]GMF58763.1 unnamed protein product [[Candida] boidinii]GMG15402.1 unnamed protein product [[Candida] boidinii]
MDSLLRRSNQGILSAYDIPSDVALSLSSIGSLFVYHVPDSSDDKLTAKQKSCLACRRAVCPAVQFQARRDSPTATAKTPID